MLLGRIRLLLLLCRLLPTYLPLLRRQCRVVRMRILRRRSDRALLFGCLSLLRQGFGGFQRLRRILGAAICDRRVRIMGPKSVISWVIQRKRTNGPTAKPTTKSDVPRVATSLLT